MPKEITYEFDHFRLDPLRRRLLHSGEPRPLTPNSFDLLCVLVTNHGRIVSKKDLISAVWSEPYVTDNNFNVTLAAVRRALEESGRSPTYIFKSGDGYRFLADVREIEAGTESKEVDERDASPVEPRPSTDLVTPVAHVARHTTHIVVSSSLYGMLYAIALILEIAYQFNRYGQDALRIALVVFVSMAGCSAVALTADRKLTLAGKRGGLLTSLSIFLLAATALFVALTYFLPAVPITESSLQSYPAQAAYLKDTSYFLILAFCFLILPFHFVTSIERELLERNEEEVRTLFAGKKLVALRAIFVRPWMLAVVLLIFAGFSLAMTAHLLDNLKPGPYTNLFTQLVYARAFVYFALGLECLFWYAKALNDLAVKAHRSGRGTRAS